MEVQRPSNFAQPYPMTAACYSPNNFDYGSENGVVSRTLCTSSFLPPIMDNDLHCRRTERFTPTLRSDTCKSVKILRPSKHGYHRRGNSPTFKLLTEVRDKLQELVDKKRTSGLARLSGRSKDGKDAQLSSDEYFGDCSSANDEDHNNMSPLGKRDIGTTLDLTDYCSDISSPGSLLLTPLLPAKHSSKKRSNNNQIHFYLPRLTDTADKDGHTTEEVRMTKGDNSDKTQNEDYANFYSVRHVGAEPVDRKSCDYKRSSTAYRKSGSKSGHRKSKAKKSKASNKKQHVGDVETKSKTSALPVVKSDVRVSDRKDIHDTENVDFLNDVTTLISEQRDLLQFSEASYTLPDLFQNGVVSKRNDDDLIHCSTKASPSFSHRISCETAKGDVAIEQSDSNCPVCLHKVRPTDKFVDRLDDIVIVTDDDMNNNSSRSKNAMSCMSKC